MNDYTLVKKILKGDSKCGEQFVTKHYPEVFRFMRCLTGSADTADDLTQQTFAKAWKGLSSYEGRASLATWLHKIAYHEYVQWLRGQHSDLPLEQALNVADLKLVSDLDSILISRAIASLTSKLREPFLLFYMQNFSTKEISELLEVPEGTIKSRLFTARERIRELIQSTEAPQANSIPSHQAQQIMPATKRG